MSNKKEKLLNIFKYQIHDFNKMVEEILQVSLVTKVNRDKYIDSNARFIYLLSLFERFIGNFNQYLIETDKSVREKYLQMFESLCDEEIDKRKKSKEWKSYYNRPAKMIKDYLILEKKRNGLFILRTILKDSVNFKEEDLDTRLKFYYEARARRNLLAHRGREPDKIYYDELKQNNIDKNFHLRILKRGLYQFSTSPKTIINSKESKDRIENSEDNLIDLSITPNYLCRACEDIIFITQSFLMDVTDNELDIDLHSFIKQGIKNKNKVLLAICYSIFGRKILHHCGGIFSKLEIDHKVNLILLDEYLRKEKILKSKLKIDYQKMIDSISDDDHFSAKHLKNLLTDYLNEDRDNFYKNTKKLINEFKDKKSDFEEWLIFQRYMRFKEFKDLFSSY